MTLWHLLILASAGASFGGAVVAAQVAKRIGNAQFVLTLVAAAIIAFGCAAILEMFGRITFRRLVSASESSVRNIYLLAMAWVVASGFLGFQLTYLFLDFLQ